MGGFLLGIVVEGGLGSLFFVIEVVTSFGNRL